MRLAGEADPVETAAVLARFVEPVGDMVALDPSVRSPGIAVWRAGKLVTAARVPIPHDVLDWEDLGARWLRTAEEIARWVVGCKAEPRVLVYERPQIYKPGKAKRDERGKAQRVDPNDQVGLAGVGSALAGILAVAVLPRSITLRVVTYLPAEWTRGMPKATKGDAFDSVRARQILSRLDDDERPRLPRQHDAIDAVGLGLKALGRFEPRLGLLES